MSQYSFDSDSIGSSESLAEESDDYRRMSLWAAASLALGLISPLALVGPPLWVIPIVGLIAAVIALREIQEADHTVVGRKAALWGLGLCVTFGMAGPAELVTARVAFAHQARPMADAFLEFLRQDEPEKAMQFFEFSGRRRPFDGALKAYYRQKENHDTFQKFVKLPAVRAVLALGQKGEPRFVDYYDIDNNEFRDAITLRYAINYEDQGRKTIFVAFRLERLHEVEDPKDQWKIASFTQAESPF